MESIQTIEIVKDYKVLVVCLTYNHSIYIQDALNGFAMQQTDFPFACIVMDDASTDGEQEVIRTWLHNECDMSQAEIYDKELAKIIIVPHLTNRNCTMAVYLLKKNLYYNGDIKYNLLIDWATHCDYIALCEGDDYWIDAEKLSIQSKCLDAHPEIDMCAHSYREVSAITRETLRIVHRKNEDCVISVGEIIKGRGDYLATDSVIYRIRLERDIPAFRKFLNYDFTLFVHGALRGGIFYINREMSVYRKDVPNSWCSKMESDKKEYEIFVDQFLKMLDILYSEEVPDCKDEINFARFSDLAYALQHLIHYGNSRMENIRILRKYKAGWGYLALTDRIKIVGKCLSPSLGKHIHSIIVHIRKS